MKISLEQLKNLRISEMRLQREIKMLQERESYLTKINAEWEQMVKSLEDRLLQVHLGVSACYDVHISCRKRNTWNNKRE